jgi:YggT family protein
MAIVVGVISWAFFVYEFLILIRVLLSWINIDPNRRTLDHPLIQVLRQVTDPVLQPLRRVIPPIGGTIDISPIVALLILDVLRRLIVGLLLRL